MIVDEDPNWPLESYVEFDLILGVSLYKPEQ